MIGQTLQTETHVSNGVSVVALHGDIDGGADATLQAAYTAATRQGAGAVLLNFGGVGYINSTGIALIVGLLAQARKDRRQLLACGLSDHYREIFEITRLSDFMTTYADETTAVAGAVLA